MTVSFDLKISAWANISDTSTSQLFVLSQVVGGGSNYAFGLIKDTDGRPISGISFYWGYWGSYTLCVHTSYIPMPGEWHHYAVSRDADNNWRFFIDGVITSHQVYEENYSFDPSMPLLGSETKQIGNQINGYLDELRITKAAVYVTNFTPPSASCYVDGINQNSLSGGTGYCTGDHTYYIAGTAMPGLNSSGTGQNKNDGKYYVNGVLANGAYASGTALLMLMNGTNGSTSFSDNSFNSLSVTPQGNVQISSSQSQFGGGSAYFDGNSYLTIPNAKGALDLTDQAFTVDAWFYWNGYNGQGMSTIFASSVDFGFGLAILNANGADRLGFWAGNNSSWNIVTDNALMGSSTILPGSWNHVAVTRNGDTFAIYLNGQLDGQLTSPGGAIGSSDLRVGIWGNDNYYFNGYIDELRIIKGEARYTSDFTPPSEEFSGWQCFTDGVSRACTQ